MKTIILTVAIFTLSVAGSLHAEEPAAASAPIKSAAKHGVIVLAPDKAVTDGRLVMRLVAYNGGTEVTQLTQASIHVATAAGQAVALIPLEQLVKEIEDANKKTKASHGPSTSDVMPPKFSHDTGTAMRDSTGKVIPGNNGGANTAGQDQVPYATPVADAAPSKESRAKAQQQIADLKAGVLQTLTIAPRTAAGAQIVTDKLMFEPTQERTLHVTVDFNGDQHELTVPVPPES